MTGSSTSRILISSPPPSDLGLSGTPRRRQRTNSEMRRLLISALLLVATASTVASPVAQHLGFFSNQRTVGSSDDPHTEGYALDLYREGPRVFGQFCVSTGIETPCGVIDTADIKVTTGAITFRAKLSTGSEVTRESGPKGRPTRDIFEFVGRLSANAVKGRVTHRNGYDSRTDAQTESVSLRRGRADTVSTSYADWMRDPANKPADW